MTDIEPKMQWELKTIPVTCGLALTPYGKAVAWMKDHGRNKPGASDSEFAGKLMQAVTKAFRDGADPGEAYDRVIAAYPLPFIAFDFTSAAASLDEPAKPSKRINEMDLDDYRRGINRIWRTPEK